MKKRVRLLAGVEWDHGTLCMSQTAIKRDGYDRKGVLPQKREPTYHFYKASQRHSASVEIAFHQISR